MKKLEFKTSKGEFVLIEESTLSKIDSLLINEYGIFIKLSDITEYQASEVVDLLCYNQYKNYKGLMCFNNSIESFRSLLESLGVNDEWNKSTTYLFRKVAVPLKNVIFQTLPNQHSFIGHKSLNTNEPIVITNTMNNTTFIGYPIMSNEFSNQSNQKKGMLSKLISWFRRCKLV